MSTFVYSTQKYYDGPWLIGRDALSELDEIVERISERFKAEAEKRIEVELNNGLEDYTQEMQDELRERRREGVTRRLKLHQNVKLTLSNSKYIQGELIKDLLANPELQDEAPTGIEIEVSASDLNARLELGRGYFARTRLNIRTSPETDNNSREAFSELQLWATKNQSPFWQQLWGRVAPNFWYIWLILIALSIMVLPSTTDNVEKFLDPIASKLLLDGISDDELPQAVELLLQYQTKQVPQGDNPELSAWFGILFYGGLIVNIILSIRPKLVIGIGRNENRLFLWRQWTKFVGITIPGIVFGSFVWPYLVGWLKSVL